MNELTVFKNEDLGRIRVIMKEGSPWFLARDVAEILGYPKSYNMLKMLDKDEISKVKYIDIFGGKGATAQSHSKEPSEMTPAQTKEWAIINESGIYHAIFSSTKPEAKLFRKWVTSEVLPEIARKGSYQREEKPSDNHPLMIVTRKFVELELEQKRQQEQFVQFLKDQLELKEKQIEQALKIKIIEAKSDAILSQSGYYSILAYGNLHQIPIPNNIAGPMGKKATKLSSLRGIEVGKINDVRWGNVNTYHESILKDVFMKQGLFEDKEDGDE